MTIVITRETKKTDFDKMLKKMEKERAKKNKGFDAKKWCGILKIDGDPVEIQRKLRDEWERDSD